MRRAMLLVLGAAALAGCGTRDPRPGPLAASVEGSVTVGAAVTTRSSWSFGVPLVNPSRHALVIDDLHALGIVGPLEVLGVGMVHHPPHLTGATYGYPPSDLGLRLRPVRGWTIGAGENDDEILFGTRMPRAGVGRISQVRIDYHSGQTHYRLDLPYSIVMCAPPKLPDCPRHG